MLPLAGHGLPSPPSGDFITTTFASPASFSKRFIFFSMDDGQSGTVV
jgi:hypothetical protein